MDSSGVPGLPFERYADDCVAHCDTEDQARALRAAIATRLRSVGLELHPEKTKVVYCKDGRRRGNAEHTSFDFLGYTFRARRANGRRGLFVGFMPAMSQKARTAVGRTIRAWHLNRRTGTDLSSLARVHQRPDPRLDQLLRGLLPLRVVLPRDAHQRTPRSMGHAEVQTTARQPYQGVGMGRRCPQHQPHLFAHWHMLPRTTSRPVGAG